MMLHAQLVFLHVEDPLQIDTSPTKLEIIDVQIFDPWMTIVTLCHWYNPLEQTKNFDACII